MTENCSETLNIKVKILNNKFPYREWLGKRALEKQIINITGIEDDPKARERRKDFGVKT